jgi:hypothetical protein
MDIIPIWILQVSSQGLRQSLPLLRITSWANSPYFYAERPLDGVRALGTAYPAAREIKECFEGKLELEVRGFIPNGEEEAEEGGFSIPDPH